MTRLKKIALVLLTITACVGCDQLTKALAKTYLPRRTVLSFAGDTLRLDYNENKGAVFSFEDFLPEKWRGLSSTIAVSSLLGALVLYVLFSPSLRTLQVVAISVLCGGILSNLLDRIVLGGNVVDFLNIGWGWYRSTIFNVADAAIASGLSLFVISVLWNLRPSAAR